MPILTKNETPAKGAKAEFELDKAALAAVASVAADSYFSDDTNWKSVEMVFNSNPGSQRRIVKFDATQVTPIADFFASAKARDIFEIERIVITDFDGGKFTVDRAELTVAEFDIDFVAPPLNYVVWDISNGPTTNATGAVFPDPNPANTEWWRMARSSISYSGNFEINFEFEGDQLGLAVGMTAYNTLGSGTGFLGGYSVMDRFGAGQVELVDSSGNFTGITSPINTSGTNVIKYIRVGSTINILVNGSSVFSYSDGNALYPLCRPYVGTLTTAYVL